MTTTYEVNFDGIVGPTHNYGGLSHGNVASTNHAAKESNPKKAALQGLAKMKFLMDLGLKQAVLPPHERPHMSTLRRLGFEGSDKDMLAKAYTADSSLLANCCSASAMWAANAGTISPAPDCLDQRLHITPANLTSNFHRSIEHETTLTLFRTIFSDTSLFAVHDVLPTSSQFGDEGAANHTRLCKSYDGPGLEFFVYGKHAFASGKPKPRHFPARQSMEASQAIARLHGVKPGQSYFCQQNPIAIDAGVFHNDVASVGNQNVLIYHEQAFFDCKKVIEDLTELYGNLCEQDLCAVKVSGHEVTISEAVQSYLFNSQLVTVPDAGMIMICPIECEENRVVKKCVERLISNNNNPIRGVHYIDLRQSMQNGGGPACLRLRVVLNDMQISKLGASILLNEHLHSTLVAWVEKHYRDRLSIEDLADPSLLKESRTALDELSGILKLGSIYEFQKI